MPMKKVYALILTIVLVVIGNVKVVSAAYYVVGTVNTLVYYGTTYECAGRLIVESEWSYVDGTSVSRAVNGKGATTTFESTGAATVTTSTYMYDPSWEYLLNETYVTVTKNNSNRTLQVCVSQYCDIYGEMENSWYYVYRN